MDAVLARLPADGARPAVACRMAGDAFVLLEYGQIAFDLDLNRYTRRIALAIETADIPGVVDLHPGIRSLLVGFDPAVVGVDPLVERLLSLHAASTNETQPRIGRHVTLPLAFDDCATREAVARHRATDGPSERDSSDIDDIVRASDLDGPSDVRDAVTHSRWCVAFVGYFPGLPFLLPMAGAAPPLEVAKLERLRAWTAEGAVSLGGPCLAIFPVEAPGSYRVFGRTVPIYAPEPGAGAFGDDGMLLRAGDIVEFAGVSEPELIEARRKAYEGRYEYRIAEQAVPLS